MQPTPRVRVTYNSPVVLTFALAAVVAFLAAQAFGARAQLWFVAWPHLADARSYVGLVSHVLGHASWQHLVGNFMLILLVGPMLEERHGSGALLAMIAVTALATGLVNLAISDSAVMGASGVAFMMILLASVSSARRAEIPLTFIAVAALYLGGEVLRSFHPDHISHMAHLVGGACGAAFGFAIRNRRPHARVRNVARTHVNACSVPSSH